MSKKSVLIYEAMLDGEPRTIKQVQEIVGFRWDEVSSFLRGGEPSGRFECIGEKPMQYRMTEYGVSVYEMRKAALARPEKVERKSLADSQPALQGKARPRPAHPP